MTSAAARCYKERLRRTARGAHADPSSRDTVAGVALSACSDGASIVSTRVFKAPPWTGAEQLTALEGAVRDRPHPQGRRRVLTTGQREIRSRMDA